MKPDEKIIAEAVRVEVSEQTGKVYVVFEITDPQTKHRITTDWIKEIEYQIIDKYLVENT